MRSFARWSRAVLPVFATSSAADHSCWMRPGLDGGPRRQNQRSAVLLHILEAIRRPRSAAFLSQRSQQEAASSAGACPAPCLRGRSGSSACRSLPWSLPQPGKTLGVLGGERRRSRFLRKHSTIPKPGKGHRSEGGTWRRPDGWRGTDYPFPIIVLRRHFCDWWSNYAVGGGGL